jgi:siroheme synthase-like protein
MPSASEPEHYVACLDLTGKRVVVVGDGEQKAEALRRGGADVLVTNRYESRLLDDAWLVIVVDTSQGERVFADASARRVFCNVEDVPELCTFILPALHRRGPITLAVSTGGASPALAQWLRDRFALQIGVEHEQLAHELRRIRPWVKQNFATYAERRDYFRERVRKALAS